MIHVLYSLLHGIHVALLLLSLLLMYTILSKTQRQNKLHTGHLYLLFFVVTLLIQHIVLFLNYTKTPHFLDYVIETLNVAAFLVFLLGFWHMQHSISKLYLKTSNKERK